MPALILGLASIALAAPTCVDGQTWDEATQTCLGTPTQATPGSNASVAGAPPPAAAPESLSAPPKDQPSGIGVLVGTKGTILGAKELPAEEVQGRLGGEPTVIGPREVKEIQAVVAENLGPIRACYATGANEGSSPRGSLVLTFAIHAQGSVRTASIQESTVGEPALEACVLEELRRLRFPKGEPATVRLPLQFGPSGQGLGTPASGSSQQGAGGMTVGEPVLLGALEKERIDEVINLNVDQLRACYQQELASNPGLTGTVVVKFVISKDGTVSSAVRKSSSLNNAVVEECLNTRFLAFKFPEPKGGSMVIAAYPFTFQGGAAPTP